MSLVGWTVVVLAAIPAVLFTLNLRVFRRLVPASGPLPPVSVLIPARNEEPVIADAVRAALASPGVDLEVVVFDDNSTDRTAEVVAALARADARVRLLTNTNLPEGWTGKQYACFVLARHARHKRLCFLDADVRLVPDAVARTLAEMESSGIALLSAFPRQISVTFLERLLLPLTRFAMLSAHSLHPDGCGQFQLARRDEYFRSGGHAAIRQTMHDGFRLVQAFRERGFRTGIADATEIASVRMYNGAREVWLGLAKHAVVGLATPRRLPLYTVVLFGGQVLPFLLLLAGAAWPFSLIAALLAIAPRLVASIRFRQPVDSVILHPLGVVVLLALQWWAMIRHLRRRPVSWKGREYVPPETGV